MRSKKQKGKWWQTSLTYRNEWLLCYLKQLSLYLLETLNTTILIKLSDLTVLL